MRGLRETIARDGRTYDLKHNPILVFCKERQNLVELVEGAGPAVNKHKRQNPLIWTVRWSHMNEVHIQSCIKAKSINKG